MFLRKEITKLESWEMPPSRQKRTPLCGQSPVFRNLGRPCFLTFTFSVAPNKVIFPSSALIAKFSSPVSMSWLALFSLSFCLHGHISFPPLTTYLHCMMFWTIQTIYFLKAYNLVMTMTETNTYKKTNTKTKTHTHRQLQIQSASKTQCMLYLSKGGGSRI